MGHFGAGEAGGITFGAHLEIGDERFTAAKSNANTKPKTVPCASLVPECPRAVRHETDRALDDRRVALALCYPETALTLSIRSRMAS